MQQSTNRIITTHTGSLARPAQVLDLMKKKYDGVKYEHKEFDEVVRTSVLDLVDRQVKAGLDVVSDGEQSKAGFASYVRERLTGYEPAEPSPGRSNNYRSSEISAFPEYYEQYYGAGNLSGVARGGSLVCKGPISYQGQADLKKDLENLRAAVDKAGASEAFVPALGPRRSIGRNEYYGSEEEYLYAIAEAMREEYEAIVDAGFILQIDDPSVTHFYGQDPSLPLEERQKRSEMDIEGLNHALRNIPPEKVRFHTCYGINQGPRVYDTPLADIARLLLKINASAIAFEAVNPRHQHEWHVWEDVKLPEDKILIPGMISHATNIVEHPELIADLLVTYAKLVGRENVIAGADCGFSAQATFTPEVHPTVVWAKFDALVAGSRLATQRLWA